MGTWSLIKKNYAGIYKQIFPVLLSSFFWFFTAGLLLIISFVGLQASFLLPVILGLVFVGPATAGSFYLTNKVVNYERVRIRDFFIGAKKFFWPSIGIFWSLLGALIVIGVDFNFFLQSQYKVLNLASAIWIYVLIFISILAIYLFPLLIEFDRLEEDYSWFDLFKYSFVLTINEIVYSLVIFLSIFVFAAFSGLVVIGLPTLFMGGISLMASNTTVNLLVKYRIKTDVSGPNEFK